MKKKRRLIAGLITLVYLGIIIGFGWTKSFQKENEIVLAVEHPKQKIEYVKPENKQEEEVGKIQAVCMENEYLTEEPESTETVSESLSENERENTSEKETLQASTEKAKLKKKEVSKGSAATKEKRKQKDQKKKHNIKSREKAEKISKKDSRKKNQKKVRTKMKKGTDQKIGLSKEDKENLLRIVEAEATGEDLVGRMLVASVVLNRVKDKAFPSTVTEVIFQNRGDVYQFSPVKDGRFYKVRISAKTRKAVNRVLSGEDHSRGALYFMSRKRASASGASWFDRNLTYLFQYGGHEFFI